MSQPDPLSGISLADLEAIRLLLQGHSVIDWHQLAFQDSEEVRRFLRVNEFDPDDPADIDRLEHLRAEAVEYLTRHFEYRIPEDVRSGVPAHELLILASRRGRHQTYACVVLKVMHVMHHLDGRETLFRLPVSDDEVFGLVESKVVHVVEEMRGAGHPITEFSWSRKERDSLITKLLAKRDSIAAHVYDKLRFRLVTRSREDLAPLLCEILHRLVPFNYAIPGETVNRILPFRQLLQASEALQKRAPELQADIGEGEEPERRNEFSGPGYRVLNFVADLPIRVSAVLRHVGEARFGQHEVDPRSVIFVLTEFQLIDAQSARENEQGENSHAAYKERQRILVKARLTRGMKWVKP
jgi:uncharacterized protein (TIGR04552 family)